MPHLSVVVPLYNESLIVLELIKRVKKNVEIITNDYEIILVNDGSEDETWNYIKTITKIDIKVKGINFSRNFGHHYAITAGLEHTDGDFTIVMDGDLQDKPETIPELYAKIIQGYDIVFVSRQNRTENSIYLLVQKSFYIILRALSGVKFDSTQANYSIINRKVVSAFKKFPENARFYGTTIGWLGFSRTFVTGQHGKRFAGKPSYTFRKRLKLAFDIILAFSDRPLKFSIYYGVTISGIAISLASYVFLKKLFMGYSVEGWASLVILILFFSGNIVIILGILGLYIGRIFEQVKNRPLYVISDKVNLN